jgi:hypothetical protein
MPVELVMEAQIICEIEIVKVVYPFYNFANNVAK